MTGADIQANIDFTIDPETQGGGSVIVFSQIRISTKSHTDPDQTLMS